MMLSFAPPCSILSNETSMPLGEKAHGATVPYRTRSRRRTLSLIAAVIGTMLEFFDFSVYAYFAPEIGKLFFPKGSASLEAVQTFAVFAGGFVMRPLGSVLIGALGDRFGTVFALRWSIALMTIPTLVTGLLPTFTRLGWAAPVILTAMRLLQGLSVGGELVGALLYTADHTPVHQRGFYMGTLMSLGVFGGLIASVVSTVLRRELDEDQLLQWGWRVPFLCGALLGLAGIFLRTNPTVFSAAQTLTTIDNQVGGREQKDKQVMSYRELWRAVRDADVVKVLMVALLAAALNSCSYAHTVWLGTYLCTLAPVAISSADAFALTSTYLAVFIVAGVIWAVAADRTRGQRKWVMVALLLVGVLQPPLFLVLLRGDVMWDYAYVCAAAVLLACAIWGNFLAFMVDLLSGSSARYIITSVAYNAGAVVGGAYPIIASALAKYKGCAVAPVLPMSIGALMCAALLALGVAKDNDADASKAPAFRVGKVEMKTDERANDT